MRTSTVIFFQCITIAGEIQALNDVWLIGDAFLKEIFPILQGLKTQKIMLKKPPPYIYEYFNTFGFITCNGTSQRNILARLLNALIEAFNRREKLPRYIVVILDKNLIEAAVQANFDYGITKMLSKWVNWFSNMIDRHVEIRKQELLNKRPGAVESDPKIIWIKMLDRPHVQKPNPRFKVQSLKGKFNELIDDIVSAKRNNHFMSISSVEYLRHFTNGGELNQMGALQYWKEFDYYFKKFDRKEISLTRDDNRYPRAAGDSK